MRRADDEDEEDWFLSLTEAQQEAIIAREAAELQRRLDAMTINQQVAYHRYFVLLNIRNNRRRLRNPDNNHIEVIDRYFKKAIRRDQRRLLELRAWRSTGVIPGRA